MTAGVSLIYHDPERRIADLERLHEEAAAQGFVEHAGRAIINVALVTPDELAEYGPVAVARMERALRYAARTTSTATTCTPSVRGPGCASTAASGRRRSRTRRRR